VTRAKAELNVPATINTTFQGNAQAFQDSLSTVPMLILAALVVVPRHPLRELHHARHSLL
jgi:multidrug efflux pump subunit AcrB